MSANSAFEEYLRESDYSVTRARRLVFAALENQEPQSIAELLKNLTSIDRASVYRTVTLFEKLDIVRRIQIGWKYKLELTEQFNFHHHHLICKNCGTIIPLRENPTIEASILALATEYGFKPIDHQLEIQGYCSTCLQKMTPAK